MTRQESQDHARGDQAASGMEALYPFLYAGTTDVSAVLEQVRASTLAKIAEIAELRRTIGDRDAERLARCAADVPDRPRSRSITSTSRGAQPSATAVSASAYCRSVDSVCSRTCIRVDWRR